MISWAYEKEIITKAQFRWIRLYIPLDPVPQSWVFEKSSHRFNLVFRINFCFLLRPRRFVKFLFVTCPNPAIIVREFLSINLPASSSSQGRQTGDAIETVGFSLCSGMDSSNLIQGLLLTIGRYVTKYLSITSVCRPKMKREAGVNVVFLLHKDSISLQRLSSFLGDERTLRF